MIPYKEKMDRDTTIKSINEFAKNHSDVYSKFDPLPELDSDTANMLIQGL